MKNCGLHHVFGVIYCLRAKVAQLVEQLTRNEQVVSPNLILGSKLKLGV